MKRLLFFIASLFAVALVSPAPVSAAVNDFTITSYDIKYELGKNAEGRSTLKTVETITALFPQIDQNHGIERAIPQKYDGHSTGLKIASVTNERNESLEYTTRKENGNTIVRIGNADQYVHGLNTYVITYQQQDVTKYFANTDDDEFYWDTNGTEWRVPIQTLTVTLTVDDAVASELTGQVACYQGYSGISNPCELFRTNNVFNVQANDLSAGENVTVAVGFKPQTFAAYKQTMFERLSAMWLIALVASVPIAILAITILAIRHTRLSRRSGERSTIVTEFLPPKDTSVTTAATVMSAPRSIFTAQLLDFAVRHYIKIHQTKEKSFLRKAEYDIEVIKDISTLKAEEQEILTDIYGSTPTVGQRLALKSLKNNTSVYSRMQNNDKQLQKLVRGDYGLREKLPTKTGWFKRTGVISLALAVLLLNPVFLAVSITAFIMAYTLWSLTDKGLALAQYLDGLKQYISVAETERLKQLQSPEGAAKVGSVDTADGGQVIKLYEKVLPYAALFGLEKEWNKQIGAYYESTGSSPDWYSGNNTAFNAAVFSSAMNNFGTAATYTSASSSTSGGSSGGGSSGGGGGGGGGGGW